MPTSTPPSISSPTSSTARGCATRTSATTKEHDKRYDAPPSRAMTLVAKLLNLPDVVLDMQVSSKKRLFEQVGLLFENQHAIARSVVFDSLFARERLGSTGLGQGVAIPHGRIKGLKEALGAFIRLAQPIAFAAPDGAPARPERGGGGRGPAPPPPPRRPRLLFFDAPDGAPVTLIFVLLVPEKA